jgi:hypothetical protein
VALVLGIVVWIGFSGRPNPPTIVSNASPPASAEPASPDPRATADQRATPIPSALGSPAASPSAAPTAAPSPADFYVISGLAGRETFRTELRQIYPGYLAGQYWLSDPPVGEVLAFEITPPRGATRSPNDALGTWLLNMDELASNHRAGLEGRRAEVAPRPGQVDAPLPVRRGFEIHVSVRLAFNEVAAIDFEIHLRQPPERESIGDDGILGCRGFSTCFLVPEPANVRR